MEESIRQREHLINELELKFTQETDKQRDLHEKELEQLEQQLEKGKNYQKFCGLAYIVTEITRQKEQDTLKFDFL